MNKEGQGAQNYTQKLVQSNQNFKKIDLNYFSPDSSNAFDCLIVLNCKYDLKLLRFAVNSCTNIILADGGTNYFYQSPYKDSQKLKYIIGDFDSIKPEIKQYYRNFGVQICEAQDQDSTDFQKCLNKVKELRYKSCICLGAFGGRLDHTLMSMHLLSKFGIQNPQIQLIMLGDNNLMLLLQPHIKNTIRISKYIQKKGCGVLTFNKIDYIETQGFKWNMGKNHYFKSLKWGQFISTSNEIVQDQIEIKGTNQLIFVCCFKEIN